MKKKDYIKPDLEVNEFEYQIQILQESGGDGPTFKAPARNGFTDDDYDENSQIKDMEYQDILFN